MQTKIIPRSILRLGIGFAVFEMLINFQNTYAQKLDTLWTFTNQQTELCDAVALNDSSFAVFTDTNYGYGQSGWIQTGALLKMVSDKGKCLWTANLFASDSAPSASKVVALNENTLLCLYYKTRNGGMVYVPNYSIINSKGTRLSSGPWTFTADFNYKNCIVKKAGVDNIAAYVLTTNATTTSLSHQMIYAVKFDNNLNKIWEKSLKITGTYIQGVETYPTDIIGDQNNDFYLVGAFGAKDSIGMVFNKDFIAKYNENGDSLWVKSLFTPPEYSAASGWINNSIRKKVTNEYAVYNLKSTHDYNSNRWVYERNFIDIDENGNIISKYKMVPDSLTIGNFEIMNDKYSFQLTQDYGAYGTYIECDPFGTITNSWKAPQGFGFQTTPSGEILHNNSIKILNYFQAVSPWASLVTVWVAYNPPPIFITSANQIPKEVLEDQLYSAQIAAIDSFPGDFVTYYGESTNPKGMSIGQSDGKITWTPLTETDSGNHVITFYAQDRVGQRTALSYTLHVTAVNDAPIIKSIKTISRSCEGDTIKVSATVTDEENDPVTFVWFKDNVKMPSKDSVTFFTTDFRSAGKYTIKLTASDPTHQVSDSLVVEVCNTPIPPVLFVAESTTVTMDSIIGWGWKNIERDPDLDTNSLFYSLQIFQRNGFSYRQYLKDSIVTAVISFSAALDTFKLNDGPFYLAVRASDKKNYTTGWSENRLYFFNKTTSIKRASAIKRLSHFEIQQEKQGLIITIPEGQNENDPYIIRIFNSKGQKIRTFQLSKSGHYVLSLNKDIVDQVLLYTVQSSRHYVKGKLIMPRS